MVSSKTIQKPKTLARSNPRKRMPFSEWKAIGKATIHLKAAVIGIGMFIPGIKEEVE